MNPSVTSECVDGITVVTLQRPGVRNAVDADTAPPCQYDLRHLPLSN